MPFWYRVIPSKDFFIPMGSPISTPCAKESFVYTIFHFFVLLINFLNEFLYFDS